MEIKNGSELKFIDNKVEGYLVRFTDLKNPDLTNDYFTLDTNFGGVKEIPIFYNHGQSEFMDSVQIGQGILEYKADGIYISGELEVKNPQKFLAQELKKRKDYISMVAELAQMGNLGWSSGAAGHLVHREPQKNGTHEIKQWILAEASLTPNPAEPNNQAMIKSIYNKYGVEMDIKAGAKISAERLNKIKEAFTLLSSIIEGVDPIEDEEKSLAEQVKNIEDKIEGLSDDLKEVLGYVGVIKSHLDPRPIDTKEIITNILGA